MTTRRVAPALLHAERSSLPWLQMLRSAVDEAAASFCRSAWKGASVPPIEPLPVQPRH